MRTRLQVHDKVPALRNIILMDPEEFASTPPGPVSFHSPADTARGGQSQPPRAVIFPFSAEDNGGLAVSLPPLPVNDLKFPAFLQTVFMEKRHDQVSGFILPAG